MSVHGVGSVRKYGKRILLVIFTIIFSFGTALFINRQFSVEHVEIIGQGVTIAIDEKKLPKNLLFFPSDAVSRSLLSENSMIDSVQIQKKYPHTLVIVVTPRVPFVNVRQNDRKIAIDRTGLVLGESDGMAPLPIISLPVPSIIVGKRITDETFMHALALLEKTKATASFDLLDEYDSASFRATMGQTDIIIPQLGEYARIATTLQTLLAGFRIKGTLPKTIDLRFDKPIVTF